MMQDTTLREALMDLKHDLGKYLRLPIAWLPDGASEEELRGALARALLQTRRGPNGVQSAREIWAAFQARWSSAARRLDPYPALVAAVERALAWEKALSPPAAQPDRNDGSRLAHHGSCGTGSDTTAGLPLERAVILEDLTAVSTAIVRLMEELEGGD